MITFKQKGNFKNTERFLNGASHINYTSILNKYGQAGVDALASVTPIDSGETASSWKYEIEISRGKSTITWSNTNIIDGVPIVILLRYGHGTANGGFVQGNDFITPIMQPMFDRIAEDAWREVTNL